VTPLLALFSALFLNIGTQNPRRLFASAVLQQLNDEDAAPLFSGSGLE
jgi:hypothetical protein